MQQNRLKLSKVLVLSLFLFLNSKKGKNPRRFYVQLYNSYLSMLNHSIKNTFCFYLFIFISLLDCSLGLLCEAQYYQNVIRVGFRLRSTLVATIFRKSLRLNHEGCKNFSFGKITNMVTTDANALQACSLFLTLDTYTYNQFD
ncbi:unnamed protein product, partial [Vitis vinifera]